jgi:deoxyribonuclease V
MRFQVPHRWDLTPTEAVALQRELAPRVVLQDELPAELRRVAGVDVGFEDAGRITRAAVAVLDADTLACVERAVVRLPTTFPYVPGLLSFREVPGVLAALESLGTLPQLILCDGQGYAHPRRFGIACHLGVITGLPTIGVAKSRLVGSHEEPGMQRGDRAPLMDRGEVIGAVLRSRAGVAPLFVSSGHQVSLETALQWVLRLAPRFRLPETTRAAHRLASLEK